MPLDYRDAGRGHRAVIIAGVIAFILQVALGPQISVFGGRINFMAAFACAIALQGDAGLAAIVGFIAGLSYDLSAPVPVGLMALILTIGSFSLATASAGVGGSLSSRSFQFLAITLIVENLVYGLALVIMGVEGSILTALLGHGLASGILSSLIGALFMMGLSQVSGSSRSFSARGKGTRFKGIR